MTQQERNEQLHKENTTLRERVNSLSDTVLMANDLLIEKEKEVARLQGAIEHLTTEITCLQTELEVTKETIK